MAEKRPRPFKVLVVGGGIAGLTMSHCLSRAKIDHVVLEAYPEVASPVGASIGFWAHGMRILSQIGCAEEILDRSARLQYSYNRLPNGKPMSASRLFDLVEERLGYGNISLERRLALEIMYNNLPDKSTIQTGKKVVSIVEHEQGVRLTLEDGSWEEGDIAIGCDGVHSIVRAAMWQIANRVSPGLITDPEKESMTVEYTCLLGVASGVPGLEHSPDMHVTYGNGQTFQIITQPDVTCFLVYRKLPQPIRGSARMKYTQEDADREAAFFADSHITETVLFRHIYERRFRGQLVNVEEGIFDHWHHGRLALMGDAAHKMAPNFAFGGNTALEDVAAFSNSLHQALENSSTGTLSRPAISAMFQEYQDRQKARVKKMFQASYLLTRVHSWDNVFVRIISRYIAPVLGDGLLADYIASLVKGGGKLQYLPVPEQMARGRCAWDDERQPSTWWSWWSLGRVK